MIFLITVFMLLFTSNFVVTSGIEASTKKSEKEKLNYIIRKAQVTDEQQLKELYREVAKTPGGLARTVDEITDEYVHKILLNAIEKGLGLVVELDGKIIGSMMKYRLDPKVFSHVLTEGSVLVHPAYQNKGVGTNLMQSFVREVTENYPDILRIELIARESNPAIKGLYEKQGFKREGSMHSRIHNVSGKFENDIPLAWTRPVSKGAGFKFGPASID